MASMGIHLGGNRCLDNSNPGSDHLRRQEFNLCSSSYNQSGRLFFPVIGNRAVGSRGTRSKSLSATARAGSDAVAKERRSSTDTAAYEKVEAWMRDSVTEIVKNLREAPLLVHVYGKGVDAVAEKPRLETEKRVEEENWEELRRKWKGGAAPYPDGVILVEEVMGQDVDGGDVNGDVNGSGDGITKLWGLVVQGKGAGSGPACYLLKTTSGSGCGMGMGLGLGCTHFCLLRVNGFRETAQSQLKNCWLLQAQAQ